MENGHGHEQPPTLNMSKDINRIDFEEMHNLIGSLKSNPETFFVCHRNFSRYEKLTFGRTAAIMRGILKRR